MRAENQGPESLCGPLPLVLAAVDGGWWQDPADEWHVRGALIDALQVDPAAVMIALSHTHAGPSLCTADVDKPGGRLIAGYLDQLRDAVISAAREALDRSQPAIITWGSGRCDLATNRDLPDPQRSRFLCGYNPAATADDTLLIGRVTDTAGRHLATLVNYACHPTTLAWENCLISPDFIGAMRETVESQTGGAPCLFLQGASGELAPAHQYAGEPAVADAHGRRLGFAALAALTGLPAPGQRLVYERVVESGAPLAVWKPRPFAPPAALAAARLDVELPLRPQPGVDQIRQELAACTDRTQAERLQRRLRTIRMVGGGPACRVPVWIWQVGDAFLVGHPNEAYSLLQTSLRQCFPGQAIVVMNIVNGYSGYLSPPELYDEDIYQVWQSPFERGALPALIAACERQIEQMLGRA